MHKISVRFRQADAVCPAPPIQVEKTWSETQEERALDYINQLQNDAYSKNFLNQWEGRERRFLAERKSLVENLLDIFEEYPAMPFFPAVWEEFPLIYILHQGPCIDLELHIKRFQRICGPENFVKVLETDDGGYFPIHAACEFSTGGIIDYLVNQNPAAAMHRTPPGHFAGQVKPLEILIDRNDNLDLSSFSTWRTLIELDPEPMKDCNLFREALIMNCPLEFFEFMVDQYPLESSRKIEIGSYSKRGEALSLEQIKILCKVLPKKQLETLKLHWWHKGIETDAFRYLLGKLSVGNGSLKHLDLYVMPASRGAANTDESLLLPASWVDWFCSGLEETTSLESLTLTFAEATVPVVQSWLQGLRATFIKLRQLKHIKLDFRFQDQGICNDTMVGLQCYGDYAWEEEAKSSSDLLEFRNCDVCDEETVKLVNQQIGLFGSSYVRMLGRAPKRAYRSDPTIAEDVTRFLTLLSSTNNKLESMEVNSCVIAVPTLLESLTRNSTLKVFRNVNDDFFYDSDSDEDDEEDDKYDEDAACRELLKNDNVTLTELYPWSLYDGVMNYYLDLNRLGRGKARTATRDELVDLLSAVELAERGPFGMDA